LRVALVSGRRGKPFEYVGRARMLAG
jgi:hypothetical protein